MWISILHRPLTMAFLYWTVLILIRLQLTFAETVVDDPSLCDIECVHGQAVTGQTDDCHCSCNSGWQGQRCDEKCIDARGQQACRNYEALCTNARYTDFLVTNCAATCGFCEKFGPGSEGFVCDMSCSVPGGTLNSEECFCECSKGWHGRLCSEKCEDKSDKCGLWGKYQCTTPSVANLCPAMCGECDKFGPGSPGFLCRLDCVNGGTLVANDEECRCACANGWEGQQCETVCKNHYELCEFDPDRPNRAVYTKHHCSEDFVSDKCRALCGRCEKFGPGSPGFECTLSCANGGTLVNNNTDCFCACPEGWEGTRCEGVCGDGRPGGCAKIAYACKRPAYASYMRASCAKTCGVCDAGKKSHGQHFTVHAETPRAVEEQPVVSHEGPGIEVAFLLDCSGSMRAEHAKDRSILQDYLTGLDYKAMGGIRVSFITFGSGANVKLNLFDADSVSRVLRSLDDVRYEGGETNLRKALQIARRLVLVHSRRKARKVIFLFTDGLYTGKSPLRLADALRGEGVEMYALSFNENYVEDTMEALVGNNSRVKVVTSASDLPTLY